jgi:hypothetical protein
MSEHSPENRHGAPGTVLRFTADTFAGLALFLALMFISTGDTAINGVLDAGHRILAGAWLTGAAGAPSAPLLLAAVFSVLVAFNLAFFRHLHVTYACPRSQKRRK